LFSEDEVEDLTDRIGAVLTGAGVEGAPVFLAGLSLGGTRALRLAAHLSLNRDTAPFHVAAVAIVDSPLDMARLWDTERRAAELAFHSAAADEGRWVTYLLETHLGGTPENAPARYAEYSPFSHKAPDGGNAAFLRDLPTRAYHEPDVDWWIENRRKSYYDMNSIDLAALINQLRVLGNENAQLVSSHARRVGYPGASPHTWSVVDNEELVEWFLSHASRAARSNKELLLTR
jgi:pimeloyl-ACP methyl ester carboxylesterase